MNIKADLNGFKHLYNIYSLFTGTFAQNNKAKKLTRNRDIGDIMDMSPKSITNIDIAHVKHSKNFKI